MWLGFAVRNFHLPDGCITQLRYPNRVLLEPFSISFFFLIFCKNPLFTRLPTFFLLNLGQHVGLRLRFSVRYIYIVPTMQLLIFAIASMIVLSATANECRALELTVGSVLSSSHTAVFMKISFTAFTIIVDV